MYRMRIMQCDMLKIATLSQLSHLLILVLSIYAAYEVYLLKREYFPPFH